MDNANRDEASPNDGESEDAYAASVVAENGESALHFRASSMASAML